MTEQKITKKPNVNAADKWTIKGISKETRDEVTAAAKKEGMLVGDYINTALDHFLHHCDHDMGEVASALKKVEKRLASIENQPKTIDTAKETVKKWGSKIHLREWWRKSNEAMRQAYQFTKQKISGKKKKKASLSKKKASTTPKKASTTNKKASTTKKK